MHSDCQAFDFHLYKTNNMGPMTGNENTELSSSVKLIVSLQKYNIQSLQNVYCGWLNFRGVPIFLVFVMGMIHEI